MNVEQAGQRGILEFVKEGYKPLSFAHGQIYKKRVFFFIFICSFFLFFFWFYAHLRCLDNPQRCFACVNLPDLLGAEHGVETAVDIRLF